MGIADTGVGLLERLRLSALLPRMEVGVEGSARRCVADHVGFSSSGRNPDPIAPHIDISLQLWNKGRERLALLGVRGGRAAAQPLHDGTALGTASFRSIALEPGAPMTESHFCLTPSDDEALRAGPGDRVGFRLRIGRNGRDRHVELEISPP
jgi:hypothetical protein